MLTSTLRWKLLVPKGSSCNNGMCIRQVAFVVLLRSLINFSNILKWYIYRDPYIISNMAKWERARRESWRRTIVSLLFWIFLFRYLGGAHWILDFRCSVRAGCRWFNLSDRFAWRRFRHRVNLKCVCRRLARSCAFVRLGCAFDRENEIAHLQLSLFDLLSFIN